MSANGDTRWKKETHLYNTKNLKILKMIETNHSLMAISSSKEDSVGKTLYSRFIKTNDFKSVPHPLSGDYTPTPQDEIDESLTSTEHSVDPESEISRVPQEVYVSTPITTNEKGYINTVRVNVNSVKPNVNTSRVNVNSVRPNVNTSRVNVNSVKSNVKDCRQMFKPLGFEIIWFLDLENTKTPLNKSEIASFEKKQVKNSISLGDIIQTGEIDIEIARKGLHSDKTDEDESEASKDADPISVEMVFSQPWTCTFLVAKGLTTPDKWLP
ncbi:hypothetical protein Tco_0837718, partial [Tanacetum coccineum]